MDSTQMKDLIRNTLSIMGGNEIKYRHEDAVVLVYRTALVESLNFEYTRQKGGGPARGFWQIEPATAEDLLFRYLARSSKTDLRRGIARATGMHGMWAFTNDAHIIRSEGHVPTGFLKHYLETNIALGIMLCRLRYWTQPGSGPIPPADEIVAQAEYWKQWYNTPGGGGTVEHFVDLVGRYGG